VLHEVDLFGSKDGNGSWSGIVAQVMSGIAHVGASAFIVTKERSEVVTFTATLGFLR
jgi:hypothetical protein